MGKAGKGPSALLYSACAAAARPAAAAARPAAAAAARLAAAAAAPALLLHGVSVTDNFIYFFCGARVCAFSRLKTTSYGIAGVCPARYYTGTRRDTTI